MSLGLQRGARGRSRGPTQSSQGSPVTRDGGSARRTARTRGNRIPGAGASPPPNFTQQPAQRLGKRTLHDTPKGQGGGWRGQQASCPPPPAGPTVSSGTECSRDLQRPLGRGASLPPSRPFPPSGLSGARSLLLIARAGPPTPDPPQPASPFGPLISAEGQTDARGPGTPSRAPAAHATWLTHGSPVLPTPASGAHREGPGFAQQLHGSSLL